MPFFPDVNAPWGPESMKFPVNSLLAGNSAFRDGFARDCLLQRGVGCELDFLNHGLRRPFVCHDMAFGIWVGLSPKETRSRGWGHDLLGRSQGKAVAIQMIQTPTGLNSA